MPKTNLSYANRQSQHTTATHSTSTSSYHVPSGHPTANGTIPSRKHLVDVRVIQRNLVYVTGIPLAIAREDILRRQEYFGRYGKIVKVAINRSNSYNNSYNSSAYGPSASAYVTFERLARSGQAAILNVFSLSVKECLWSYLWRQVGMRARVHQKHRRPWT